jgi:hypothetical protein
MDIAKLVRPVGHTAQDALRGWLRLAADALIPPGAGMPGASDADVAGAQLDLVLAARPDLLPLLKRAHQRCGAVPAADTLAALDDDMAALDALLLVVAGGYYTSPSVVHLLRYTGQSPEPVRADAYPPYVEQGLLDGVLARGPIYRTVDGGSSPSPHQPDEKDLP